MKLRHNFFFRQDSREEEKKKPHIEDTGRVLRGNSCRDFGELSVLIFFYKKVCKLHVLPHVICRKRIELIHC